MGRAPRSPDGSGVFRRFAEQAVTPKALEHLLAAREMDWLMVEVLSLTLPEEGMAREAALCVRDDGMSLPRVAEQAGAVARDVRVYLEDTEAPLDDMLVSSGEGESWGRFPDEQGFVGERRGQDPTLCRGPGHPRARGERKW